MKKFILLLLLCLSSINLLAQIESVTLGKDRVMKDARTTADDGRVLLIQDKEFEDLMVKFVAVNKHSKGFMGYRVQVFFSSAQNARSRAQHIQRIFEVRYPEHEVYLNYNAPFFSVRVGDFRSKNDAMRFKRKLAADYPDAYVVEDIIKFPAMGIE